MYKVTIFISVISLSLCSCSTFRSWTGGRSAQEAKLDRENKAKKEAEENARREEEKYLKRIDSHTDGIAWFSKDPSWINTVIECEKIKKDSQKQQDFVEEMVKVGKANVNLKYSHANQQWVENVYLVNREKNVYDAMEQAKKDGVLKGHHEQCVLGMTAVRYYEQIARLSHGVEKENKLRKERQQIIYEENMRAQLSEIKNQQHWNNFFNQLQLNRIEKSVNPGPRIEKNANGFPVYKP